MIVNIAVQFLVLGGLAFALAPVVSRGFAHAGATSESVLGWLSFLLPLTVLQLLTVGMHPWAWAAAERRNIDARLRALGIGEGQLAAGLLMGIADPDRGGAKRASLEDDVGMLWIQPDALRYRGDTMFLEIANDALVSIERAADPRALSSFFGGVHVVLRYRVASGEERRVRLYPQGYNTASGIARAHGALAQTLAQWHSTGAPAQAAGLKPPAS
jgi:hypothetical protein